MAGGVVREFRAPSRAVHDLSARLDGRSSMGGQGSIESQRRARWRLPNAACRNSFCEDGATPVLQNRIADLSSIRYSFRGPLEVVGRPTGDSQAGWPPATSPPGSSTVQNADYP